MSSCFAFCKVIEIGWVTIQKVDFILRKIDYLIERTNYAKHDVAQLEITNEQYPGEKLYVRNCLHKGGDRRK